MRMNGKKTKTTILLFLLCAAIVTSFLGIQISKTSAEESAAVLTGVIYDQGVDTDGDGAFNYLEIGVEVNVTVAGYYRIEAFGLTSDSGYIYVGDSPSVSLEIGVQVAYLRFNGLTIYNSGLNPKSVSSIILYDRSYKNLGELNETPLSRTYFYTEFDAPGAVLTGIIDDQGIDNDGNGAFDFLEINVEVNVTGAGDYTIEANDLLATFYYEFIDVDDSHSVFLDIGIQVVHLRFNGVLIYISGLNPTNVSDISLYDKDDMFIGGRCGIPLSRTYLHTEFDVPGAALTCVIFDRGIDDDEDGTFDFLEIGIEVNVTEAGNYSIQAYGLRTNDNKYINVLDAQFVTLDVGVHMVYLNYDGPTIHIAGLNPTKVDNILILSYLSLVEGYKVTESLDDIPLSRMYLYTEFDIPGAALTGVIHDRGVDTDGDGSFNFLEIGVEVNVTEAGDYYIQSYDLLASGYRHIVVGDYQSAFLNVGIQVVHLRFDGITIYSSGLNATKVSQIYLSDYYKPLGELANIPLSRTYYYAEFDAPVIVMVGVKVGDWAKYNITGTWQSTDPRATEPSQITEFRNLAWVKIEVQSVSNTYITILQTYHYKNGTDQSSPPVSGDIATQYVTLVISGNLSQGDIIPGTATSINGTIIRSYAGANRKVNYVSYSSSFFGMNMTQTTYWDKATGILCEMLMETTTLTNSYVTTNSTLLRMIETNMWKIPTDLSCFVSKNTLTEGEGIIVSGFINATLSGKTVTLTYRKPDGSTLNRNVTTVSDGSYTDSYNPDSIGLWSVAAFWEGDSMYNSAISPSWSFTVIPKPFIETPLGMAIMGGIIIVAAGTLFLVLKKRG